MEYVHFIINFIGEWYWVPLLFLYVGVISTLIIENGNPTKTLSWVLVIVFLPVIGIILYYLFGQKFSKVKRIKKVNDGQAIRLKKEWERLEPYMEKDIEDIRQKIGDLSQVFTFLKNERLSSPTLGNKVELLINGEHKFLGFMKALREARHSIHIEYYIYELDTIGLEILTLLEEKAAEGVYVRLMVDSIGSPELVKYMQKQKDSRIDFKPFMPVTFTSLANSNYRNHRKIAIFDGDIGYIGGINISDRYINKPTDVNKVYWRDTSVRVEGAAVNMLQISFWNSWNLADGKPFLLSEGYLQNIRKEMKVGDAAVSFVSSDPGSVGPYNMEAILIALGEADTKIQLVTPYYVPTDELATALKIAAASGIEVELMLPKESDSYIVQHASLSFVKPLLERGVKVYFYTKGFIHAKTINIDGKISFVGTVNLDTRSFYINYEIAAVISDPKMCRELEDQFEIDKADCELMTLKEWKRRKTWKRTIDSVCRLLAPLL
ncbi:cardiolipin synthase [Sphingobacterium psychroaquaticum]|uniref:Cardiolipin synthase n=1 Tax=Sphingobacterium psychroaquaticum TaxID=561061 RepID=A0A1X7HZT9_9SPHI|nr:cardiolipin synthase [Sphingobacterium psychroaquaticum]SMG07431.1 cardiolipin synthase [Sphingobacterium psychroaquaticum]